MANNDSGGFRNFGVYTEDDVAGAARIAAEIEAAKRGDERRRRVKQFFARMYNGALFLFGSRKEGGRQ